MSLQDPSGASRSMSRTEFIDLAWSSVGRGSREDYGLLFDSVVVTQGDRVVDSKKEEVHISWRGLCSFLLVELSEKVKRSRSSRVPCWKPPRTLTCPHRDPVQKVKMASVLQEETSDDVGHLKHVIFCRMLSENTFWHSVGESKTLLTASEVHIIKHRKQNCESIRAQLIRTAHLFSDKWGRTLLSLTSIN